MRRTTMADLRYEFEKWKGVRADMLQAFNELWDDDQALLDTVEGETGLTKESMAEKAAEEILQATALAAACKARAQAMAARASRINKQIESLRGLLIQLFCITEMKTLVTPVATITLGATKPKLLIQEESDIPAKYWIDPEPLDPVLDEDALKDDLVAGAKIEGAVMSLPGTKITLRAS
jgi:hypothetical protein